MPDIHELIRCRVREERKGPGISIEKLVELAVATLEKISKALVVPACELMNAMGEAACKAGRGKVCGFLDSQPKSALKTFLKTLDALMRHILKDGVRRKRPGPRKAAKRGASFWVCPLTRG
jgi:hypothetical protein